MFQLIASIFMMTITEFMRSTLTSSTPFSLWDCCMNVRHYIYTVSLKNGQYTRSSVTVKVNQIEPFGEPGIHLVNI